MKLGPGGGMRKYRKVRGWRRRGGIAREMKKVDRITRRKGLVSIG